MGAKEWAERTKRNIDAIHKRSIELLADEMARTKGQGGRVPFDTGNLARSLLASTQAMPKTSEALSTGSNVGAVVATMRVDQPVWLGYQAVYARRTNFGFVGADSKGRVFNQPGNHFVEGAIAQWPQIVQNAVREIQGT
jgi:hypothetical protein